MNCNAGIKIIIRHIYKMSKVNPGNDFPGTTFREKSYSWKRLSGERRSGNDFLETSNLGNDYPGNGLQELASGK